MTRNIKTYLDSADLHEMRCYEHLVGGFTTNPTLMRRAGVTDYLTFAKEAVAISGGRPISFEVIGDESTVMIDQARILSSLEDGVYVKIPIRHTSGVPTTSVIATLLRDGIKVNITGICNSNDVLPLVSLLGSTPAIISVFAGRIADTGRDATQHIAHVKHMLHGAPHTEVLWASTRQVYNIVEADLHGADIITMTPSLIDKLYMLDRPLGDVTMDTVRQFDADSKAAGYRLGGEA